jgi:hypothetical protein
MLKTAPFRVEKSQRRHLPTACLLPGYCVELHVRNAGLPLPAAPCPWKPRRLGAGVAVCHAPRALSQPLTLLTTAVAVLTTAPPAVFSVSVVTCPWPASLLVAALSAMCVMQASPCKLPTPLKSCHFSVVGHALRALSRSLTLLTTAVVMLTTAPFCA